MKSSTKVVLSKIWNVPSRFGEVLGWNWLIYNPGVFFEFAMVAKRNAPIFGKAVSIVFKEAKTFNDIGCGTGQFVKAINGFGSKCQGYEHSLTARLFGRLIGLKIQTFDLTRKLPILGLAKADISYSLEVGEHIPSFMSADLVKTMVDAGSVVIFSAAQPGQLGHGHINCQTKIWWAEEFQKQGYIVDRILTDRFVGKLAENAKISAFLVDNIQIFTRSKND